MRVYVDGEELTVARPTVADALFAARGAAEARGRVVVEAALDGAPISDQDLDSPPTTERPGAEVRFVTADASALVRVSLLEVADALDTAAREQTAASDLIQSGDLAAALPHLSKALLIWDNVRQVVLTGTQLLGMKLEGLSVRPPAAAPDATNPPVGVQDAITALATHLAEIKRSLEAQDWAGLSDALAYDMQDQAALWRGVLIALADTVSTRR